MKKTIIAYIPVVHEGYRTFLQKHSDADTLYILGKDIITEFKSLTKNINALEPRLIKKSLEVLVDIPVIEILSKNDLKKISRQKGFLVMPKENVSMELKEKYFKTRQIIFDSIFLRWDKHKSVGENPVTADGKISRSSFDKKIMNIAFRTAEQSSDFWRHVGAVIVKNGRVVIATHNKHVPSEQAPYVNGDPRNNFSKGEYIELSTAIHGEAGAIAQAAQRGISLKGASIYVTTFPCPPCAKLIAYSGIKKLYYSSGYSVLDGQDILKSQGVEIIFVE